MAKNIRVQKDVFVKLIRKGLSSESDIEKDLLDLRKREGLSLEELKIISYSKSSEEPSDKGNCWAICEASYQPKKTGLQKFLNYFS